MSVQKSVSFTIICNVNSVMKFNEQQQLKLLHQNIYRNCLKTMTDQQKATTVLSNDYRDTTLLDNFNTCKDMQSIMTKKKVNQHKVSTKQDKIKWMKSNCKDKNDNKTQTKQLQT